jgi:hypothetical protein
MANNFSGDANCVALWRFESGALTTDSKGTNTLAEGGTPTADTATFKEGAASVNLDPSTDYLVITDANLNTGFPLKSGDTIKTISVCGWFRCDAVGARQIFSKYATVAGGRSFTITLQVTSDRFGIRLGHTSGDSYQDIFGMNALVTGRWYHFGVTYQDSDKAYKIRLWDDTGAALIENLSGTATNNIFVNTTQVCVGTRSNLAEYFDGLIDEMVVFKDILTTDEIDQIRAGTYEAAVSVTPPIGSISASGIAPRNDRGIFVPTEIDV